MWFFSSGPLDESADQNSIAPTDQVAVLAERIGAKAHVTFGGRLEADAQGFPASAMAKEMAGDWAQPEARSRMGRRARCRPSQRHAGRARRASRAFVAGLLAHAVVGWVLCAATMGALLSLTSLTVALVSHAVAAPLFFVAIGWHYFRARGARDPLPTAAAFCRSGDAAGSRRRGGCARAKSCDVRERRGSVAALCADLRATWATGALMSTMPWAAPPKRADTSVRG